MTNFSSLLRLRATRPDQTFGRLALLLLTLLPLLGRAGTPVLTFQATVAGVDVTAFVDKVEIVNALTGVVVAVPNGSFETFASLANGTYGYNPSGASWTFNARSGIAANNGALSPPPTTNGSFAAFLQTTSSGAGAFSQTLPAVPAGSYFVRVQLAQRSTGAANQGVAIFVDGREVGRSVPANDEAYHSYTSAPFLVDAVLRIEGAYAEGLAINRTDAVITFVEMVELLDGSTNAPVPGTPVANASFENFTMPADFKPYYYAVQPAGASWQFSSTAGIAAGGSQLGNPSPSPNGGYVAFLRSSGNPITYLGSINQTLTRTLSGSYKVRLQLAQGASKYNPPQYQHVRVYINDVLLSTLEPGSTDFQTYTTGTFSFQPLVVINRSPASNQRNVALATNVAVTLSQPLQNTAATLGALRVHSQQRGGQRRNGARATASLSGSTITLDPTTDFKPGETVSVTIATAAAPTTGPALAGGKVHQFTTATSGTGRGRFAGGSDPAMPGFLTGTVLGDVDGDGDLDVVATSLNANRYNTAVSVRLNGGDATGSNTGTFSNGSEVDLTAACSDPGEPVLGDVDNDGDLDVLVPSHGKLKVFVRLNGGDATGSNTGVFSNGSAIDISDALLGGYLNTNGDPQTKIKLGDLDGDGDLDLLAIDGQRSKAAVFLNGGDATGSGTGVFGYGSSPEGQTYNTDLALGDVDGDGDLDFVEATKSNGVLVRLNGGDASGSDTGTFGGGADFGLGAPHTAADAIYSSVALGDVDGDGDLDLVAGGVYGKVWVRQNGGDASGSNTGVFSTLNTLDLSVGSNNILDIALVDVDADGDLDFVSVGDAGLKAALNGGDATGSSTGIFKPITGPGVVAGSHSLSLGDIDGDGDLDLAASQSTSVAVRLNQGPPPAITSLSPDRGPVGTRVTVTGTGLSEVQGVRVNGIPGTLVGTPTVTSLIFVVGVGSTTGPVSFTSTAGIATDPTIFTVQATTITGLSPTRNQRSAPATANVAITFADPPQNTAATLGAVRVFSQQRGGLLRNGARATATVSGNTLTLDPAADFKPGETVLVTTTTAATTTSGATLTSGKVHQFTVATGGAGRGVFAGGTDPAVGSTPQSVATGDVDGDGDLDLVTASHNASGTVSVRLNGGDSSGSNTGVFSGGSNVAVDSNPHDVVLGDVDGDGDLDLLTANDGGTLSVRLNGGDAAGGGAGVFSNGSTVTVGGLVRNVVLGDVDGDGDLDLATANDDAVKSLVFVRLNGGDGTGSNTGVFLGGTDVYLRQPIEYAPTVLVTSIVLADVDNDGDLDIAAAYHRSSGDSNGHLVVRLNGGDASGSNPGVFSGGSDDSRDLVNYNTSVDMAVGDMDGDGDLDLVLVSSQGVATIFENGRTVSGEVVGQFSGIEEVAVGSNPRSVALGDVNSDGRLDIVTANAGSNTVSVRLATGRPFGVIPSPGPPFADAPVVPNPAVGNSPSGVALADVDGDGDLDFVTANAGSATASVRLNQPPAILSFTPTSGPAGTSVTLTGTFLAEVTSVTVNGTAGTITGTPTATSLTFVVGAGSTTGPITVSSPVGIGTSSTNFTVVPPTITSFTPAGGPVGTSVTVTGTYLDGATSVSVNGKAGTITANTPTSVTFTVAAGSTTGPIRLVVTAGPATSSTNFTVLPPTITSFTPDNGPVGTSVTITGLYLDGTTSVSVNGKAGTIMANTPTSVTFTVAAGSTTGPIRLVMTAGPATSSTNFTVLPPTITSFTPDNGPVGTSVTITGLYLDGTTSVSVNGTAGIITANTSTSVTFTVAPGTTTGRIRLVAATGSATSSTDFVVEYLAITGLSPTRNQRNVAPTTNVAVAFSQPLQNSAATLGAVRVFSQQRGGLLRNGARATASVNGNTLTLNPATDFKPGETVSVTTTAAATSSSGSTPNVGRVHQFTVATGGTGRGVFGGGTDPTTGTGTSGPTAVAAADVDGDGDLDLLAANYNTGTVSVRLNGGDATGSNTGVFSNGSDPTVGAPPRSLAVGDVDGDGDLDFLTGSPSFSGTVSVRLNGGDNTGSNTGTFSSGTEEFVGYTPRAIALGDVDGDGDLDLVTLADNASRGITTRVSVRLNGGDNTGSNTGTFSNGSNLLSAEYPFMLALGDVDGDGDLDLVVSRNETNANSVLVRLNGGDASGSNTGIFSNGSEVSVGVDPRGVALGDVDGDGDLDLLTTIFGSGTVSVRLNGGDATGSNTGIFSNGSNPAVGSNPNTVVLGDVDGDGDLDLLTTNGLPSGTINVLLNGGNGLGGGTGTFSNPNSSTSSVAVGNTPRALALADLDGDGDLDILAANALGNTVSVRLNQAPAYSLSSVSPAAELPGQVVTLIGTGFTSGSTVQFGGTTASITAVSATSLTVAVPAGLAGGSAPISVSTGGLATPGLPFTVLAVYDGGTLNDCAPAVPATASVGDGAWHYLLASNGQVVAAYNYTGASLGNLAIDAMRADPAQPVRQDGGNRYYLGRNWHLTASAGRFDGRTVGLRLYGLNSEQARLLVADNTATLANLKATQYSGPNEDCQLANNSSAGESRVLPAPATSPVGTTWFVAELAVADHFSEFYLTGSPTPLPVELTAFTATATGPAAVRLAWTTASEKNSASFDVERSLDGRTFTRIGTVAAAGSSSTPHSYELLDSKLPTSAALLYYRLRQVDQDGTVGYSPVRTVALTGAAAGLALFPNPTHGGTATLTGTEPGAAVTVFDVLGREVLAVTADADGTATLALPRGLATGVYVVRTGSQALRLTVE